MMSEPALDVCAYPVLAAPCEYTHEEKRSQFIALLEPLRASLQALTQGRAELQVLTPAEPG